MRNFIIALLVLLLLIISLLLVSFRIANNNPRNNEIKLSTYSYVYYSDTDNTKTVDNRTTPNKHGGTGYLNCDDSKFTETTSSINHNTVKHTMKSTISHSVLTETKLSNIVTASNSITIDNSTHTYESSSEATQDDLTTSETSTIVE